MKQGLCNMRRVTRNEDYTMLLRCLRYDEVSTMSVQFDFFILIGIGNGDHNEHCHWCWQGKIHIKLLDDA